MPAATPRRPRRPPRARPRPPPAPPARGGGTERRRLFEQIVAEILGLGPIEPLLSDDTITEIMVNGARNIYIERRGKITREPAAFESDDHLMRIIDRIVSPLGRRINAVISGGTGSGKTTMLNVLSQFIPNDERIVTIENAAELQLRQEHVVTLKSRPPNIEGRGE